MAEPDDFSLTGMTDQWGQEISLDKLVAALASNPTPAHIEMVCRAAFVDGAVRMLRELHRRSTAMYDEAQAQHSGTAVFGPDMTWTSGS